MNFKTQHVVFFALLLMPGCAARRHYTRVTAFGRETPQERIAPAPPPPSPTIEAEQEPPPRAAEQRPQEPPPLVAAVPKVKRKSADIRPAPKKQSRVQAPKRPKTRRPPAPVVAAAAPGKKENSGGLPPLAYGLMPFGAAALWMGGRAAAHAAKKG